MKFILAPFGSSGDVHPFVGIGLALRDRGHEVVFVVESYFVPLIETHGFAIRPYGEPGKFEEGISDPRLWHPTRSLTPLFKAVLQGLRPVYEGIAEQATGRETAVICGALALGALVAREVIGVPTATLQLAPSALRTVHDTPILGRVRMPRWWPKSWKRGLYRVMDAIIDRHLAADLNAFRGEFGLEPIRRVFKDWWYSSDVNLAMFPEWFAARQPDWPANVVSAGFPLYDEADVTPMPEDAARFLDAGTPPVLFAAGTAMTHASAFFAQSAEACRRIGRRGIFVTKFPSQIPASLPDGVRHFPYLPFSQVLPRCAAIVHHGGIGTMSQAMRAGLPMLIRPMAHDQRDNAARVKALGVGDFLLPHHYNASSAARGLDRLIASTAVRDCARMVSDRLRSESPLDRACEAVEAIVSHPLRESPSVS